MSAPLAPVLGWASGPALAAAWTHALWTALLAICAVVSVYAARHYLFTINRLFGRQRHPYLDVDTADWPSVTVLVAAHNEEAVIAGSLQALLEVDYPPDRLQILVVNDRSTDGTRAIVDAFVAAHPGRVEAFHRQGGKPGKAAALKDATAEARGELLIVFDADYVPGRGLLKGLAAPFFDVETGAVMGRVVPLNTERNLLTRLLDMERSGGYQVDQQARMNLALVPQYGGTVGGVRRSALEEVGGWRDDALAEDTDLTFRLLLAGWKTVYQNRSECYEEVPESWPVRVRQIMRWAKGHDEAALRYTAALLRSRKVTAGERLDGLLVLGIYFMSPLLLAAWLLTLALFFLAPTTDLLGLSAVAVLLAVMSYGTLGNFAAFFEIAAAVHLDGSRHRIALLPLNFLGFLVSLVTITRAAWQAALDRVLRRRLVWHKTERYRQGTAKVA